MRVEGKRIELPVPVSNEVGISNIPSQVLKKVLQRGINFNLLVVAEKGAGAKTLVNSVYGLNSFPPKKQKISEYLSEHCVTLKSANVSFKLTIYLYRGKDPKEIEDFLTAKNTFYYKNNIGINRERSEDPRIHASLLLISPLSFRPEDTALFKALAELSSTLPVITKRDVFTHSELEAYKKRITQHIDPRRSLLFKMPFDNISFPLSTVASNTMINTDSGTVRGREYQWGIINAQDPAISDLPALTHILMTGSFIDLRRSTALHYMRWKETSPDENPSKATLDAQGKALLKEIEQTITQRLGERFASLEQEEKTIDQAVHTLNTTISDQIPAPIE
ncbi:septin 5 [Nematocida homosporus]|uniref:septin 5 n=1 Tax=Nematocida homosporus TaxID=1912981 RepID=UPI0022207B1E|nr:septin 5 [Nematocida homosporus]KAI5184341.1 septin 5 [Nematocida homosporus]